jgi:hypothetical protein
VANNYTQFSTTIETDDAGLKWWRDYVDLPSGTWQCEGPPCEIEIQPTASKGGTVWLYSNENCDIDRVGDALQAFLKATKSKGRLGFSWADTCSKMRDDEFGGGALVATAKRQHYINTGQWLHKELGDSAR